MIPACWFAGTCRALRSGGRYARSAHGEVGAGRQAMDVTELAATAYALATVVVIASQVRPGPWGAVGRLRDGRQDPGTPAAGDARGSPRPGRGPGRVGVGRPVVRGSRGAVPARDFPWLIWVAVAVSTMSVAMNAVSRSPESAAPGCRWGSSCWHRASRWRSRPADRPPGFDASAAARASSRYEIPDPVE